MSSRPLPSTTLHPYLCRVLAPARLTWLACHSGRTPRTNRACRPPFLSCPNAVHASISSKYDPRYVRHTPCRLIARSLNARAGCIGSITANLPIEFDNGTTPVCTRLYVYPGESLAAALIGAEPRELVTPGPTPDGVGKETALLMTADPPRPALPRLSAAAAEVVYGQVGSRRIYDHVRPDSPVPVPCPARAAPLSGRAWNPSGHAQSGRPVWAESAGRHYGAGDAAGAPFPARECGRERQQPGRRPWRTQRDGRVRWQGQPPASERTRCSLNARRYDACSAAQTQPSGPCSRGPPAHPPARPPRPIAASRQRRPTFGTISH